MSRMPTLEMTDKPDNLPRDAQEIYQQAYGSAWDRFQLRQRRDNPTREEAAHRVALSAVEEKFEKTEKGWRAI